MPIAMRLDNNAKTPSFQDVSEMLSKMKTLLIDVLLETSVPLASRIKLKDCISMVESFSNFLNNNFKEQGQNTDNIQKPLYSGLSRSSEHLNIKPDTMSKSRSTSDLSNFDSNGNNTWSPTIAFDDDHSDYVITAKDAAAQDLKAQQECYENVPLRSLERKATKKRIKMLRWLKKAIVDKGQDDTTIIGDIYRIKCLDNHVKLWCLLRDRQLHCYVHMTDTTPDLVIPLDNCLAVPSTVNCGKKFAFDIEKEGVKLATFAARSAKERARWIEIVKSKRGTIPFAEFEDDSGEEAAVSGSSEEDEDNGYDYIQVADHRVAEGAFKLEGEYVLPMSEDGYEDAGYISVVALESEIIRRKTSKKKKKYNPNITSKSGIEYLYEKDAPSTFMSTIPKDVPRAIQHRSPAPLPRSQVLLPGKTQAQIATDVPIIQLDSVAKLRPENEPEKSNESDKDFNNNLDVGNSGKENVSPELVDCEQLPFEDQGILHCQLSASSWLPDSPPSQARFDLPRRCREKWTGAWRPETSDKTQFLEIDVGDVMTVSAIAVKGRPDFDENGGEFVKSFTVHYSIDKETWTPYKTHGKLKIFQGISSANQECKKYFKTKIAAQYFRIHPQTWQNHVALRVALYKEDVKSKGMKKKGDKSKPTFPATDHTSASPKLGRKAQLKKEDISDPIYPSSDCFRTEVVHIGDIKTANTFESSMESSDSPASMESRINLREKLLSKEKREQITKLEILKKHVDQAKGRMIVTNTPGLKREAVESEHDYLVANLELVKAKKRLIDIETEMRELRLFGDKYNAELQEGHEVAKPTNIAKPTNTAKPTNSEKPTNAAKPIEVVSSEVQAKPMQIARPAVTARLKKPPIKRRPSKEVMVWNDDVSPEVDPEEFNSPGDAPPALKVLNNVKLFENLNKE